MWEWERWFWNEIIMVFGIMGVFVLLVGLSWMIFLEVGKLFVLNIFKLLGD